MTRKPYRVMVERGDGDVERQPSAGASKTGSGLCGFGEVQAYLVPIALIPCVRCVSSAAMASTCVGQERDLSFS